LSYAAASSLFPGSSFRKLRGKQRSSPMGCQVGLGLGDPQMSQSRLAMWHQGRQSLPGPHGEGVKFFCWNLPS